MNVSTQLKEKKKALRDQDNETTSEDLLMKESQEFDLFEARQLLSAAFLKDFSYLYPLCYWRFSLQATLIFHFLCLPY